MPKNNQETKLDKRFVNETLPAVNAYIKVSMNALEKEILPAMQEANAFSRNNAEEVLTILKRLSWHLDAADDAQNNEFEHIDSDQAEFDALSTLGNTTEAPRVEIDANLLTTTLRDKLDNTGSLKIHSFKLLPGGRSKLTALFEQTGCDWLPKDLVLRVDWASAVTGTSVVTEYDVLKAVHTAGLKVPKPYALIDNDNPLGAAFMIVDRLSGSPLGDIFEPPKSESIALELAEQLGKLHSIPMSELSHLTLIEEREYGETLLQEKFNELNGTFNSLGDQNAIVAKARDIIETQLSTISGLKTLVHSDLGFHNFLIDDGKLSAVLDWELAHFGHPANDLGYIQGDIVKMVSWDTFMAAYFAAGGPKLSSKEIDFYFLWSLFRLYCLLLGAREGIKMGLVQDVAVARVCLDSIPRLVETLANGITRITSR